MSTPRQSTRDALHREMSRRDFIPLTGSTLVTSLLVACGSQTPLAEGDATRAADSAASDSTEKTFACATCETRIKVEENPNSFQARRSFPKVITSRVNRRNKPWISPLVDSDFLAAR